MHGDYGLQEIVKMGIILTLWATYTEHLLWESSSERSRWSCICVALFWRPDIKLGNVLCHFFTVVESHPDNMLEDLRLDKPFPELTEHIQDYDLEHMDKKVSVWFALCSQHRGRHSTGILWKWLLADDSCAKSHLNRASSRISHEELFLPLPQMFQSI